MSADLRPRDFIESGCVVRGVGALLLHSFIEAHREEWNRHTARAMASDSLRADVTALMLALEFAAESWRISVDISADGNGPRLDEMTTDDAGTALGVSPRRILQLLDDGVLFGRRLGREWLVSASSVEREKERRNEG